MKSAEEQTMKIIYPAICHYEDGGYWCEFPDLEGCFSQGDSAQEIVENAKEALECHCGYFFEQEKTLPKPTLITDLKADGKDFLTYIECDIQNSGKSIRKNVTIPDWLNRKAESAQINFSQTLQEALCQKLGVAM